MADENCRRLLKEANLAPDIIDKFKREGIEYSLLTELNVENLNGLLPTLGEKIKLLKFIKTKIQTSEQNCQNSNENLVRRENAEVQEALLIEENFSEEQLRNNDDDNSSHHDNGSVNILDNLQADSSVLADLPVSQAVIDNVQPNFQVIASVPVSQAVIENRPADIDPLSKTDRLQTLLESSDDGKAILKYYQINNILSDFLRNKLTTILVSDECSKSLKYQVNPMVWVNVSREISSLFPNEKSSIYYVPYVKLPNGTKICAKGKLADKYSNKRTRLRKSGLISPVKRKRGRLDEQPAYDLEDEEDIAWLINNTAPWDLVSSKWKSTWQRRREILQQNCLNTQAYFDKFPVLKIPEQGHLLILEDFNQLFPNHSAQFFENWDVVAEKICNLAIAKGNTEASWRTSVTTGTNINFDDAKDIQARKLLALRLLPYLVSSPGVVNRLAAVKWKPSKAEVGQSVLLEVAISDLENSVEQRKEKLRSFNLTSQPLTILAEKVDGNISSYVNIDLLFYKISSPLEAFDLCFKSFHVFNLQYPRESKCIFDFIQKYVYHLPLQKSGENVAAEALAANLKL